MLLTICFATAVAASCLVAGLGGGMEYHGTRLSARARRPEPSWPTVIATTLRLWLERHPLLGKRGPNRKRALALAVAAVALGAGVAGVVIGHATTSSRVALASSPAAPAQAARPGQAPAALGA